MRVIFDAKEESRSTFVLAIILKENEEMIGVDSIVRL